MTIPPIFSGNAPQKPEPVDFGRRRSPIAGVASDSVRFGAAASDNAGHKQILTEIPYDFDVISDIGNAQLTPTQATTPLSQASTVAIGDVHGSILSVFRLLLTSKAIQLPAKDAQRFIQLQTELNALTTQRTLPSGPADPMSQEELDQFQKIHQESQEIITKIQANPNQSKQKIVMIGDELGDRGPSDPLMMSLIQRLETTMGQDRVVKIASNHGHCILPMLYGKSGTEQTMLDIAEMHVPHVAHYFTQDLQLQASGVRALEGFNRKDLISQYQEYFKSYQLLHYDAASKTLYGHAPIRTENVRELVQLMRQKESEYGKNYLSELQIGSYDDINAQNLGNFVDAVNQFYRDYVGRVFKTEKLDPDVEAVLFNRYDTGFVWNIKYPKTTDELPFKDKGVEVFVHGHDLGDADVQGKNNFDYDGYRRVNLDNTVGKGGDDTGKTQPIFIQP